jgi:hypothetical protein
VLSAYKTEQDLQSMEVLKKHRVPVSATGRSVPLMLVPLGTVDNQVVRGTVQEGMAQLGMEQRGTIQ